MFGALILIGVLGACQSIEPRRAAVLERADVQTIETLKTVLAQATNRARIELGPGDLTQSSAISVLPPRLGPYEGRSTAMPTHFELMTSGGKCFAVRRDSGEAYELPGIRCRPLTDGAN